jgi:tripartite-type tricarboxylate transporter receptor subunit TctC
MTYRFANRTQRSASTRKSSALCFSPQSGEQALFVPARTPSEVVRKISADTNAALAEPAIKDKVAASGYVAEGSSPEELAKLLRAEIAKWSAVIKSVGIKID